MELLRTGQNQSFYMHRPKTSVDEGEYMAKERI